MPDISVVLLSWDGLELTTRCVQSLRSRTDAEIEIIIVDNGSKPEVQEAVAQLADSWILNPNNLGFASGMNQGLELVRSPRVVFANNDTVFPPGWDGLLVETLESRPEVGLVVPAVTASGNQRTVRQQPGSKIERLLPFSEPPSGIVYLMHSDTSRSLGGWSTEYRIASAEDWDLCFTIWLNGMEIYYDTRVLVEHVSKGTASEKLDDWRLLWRENRNRFLDKWSSDVSHLVTEGSSVTDQRLEQLRVSIDWMRQFYHTRDELLSARAELEEVLRLVKTRERRIDALRHGASLSARLRNLPRRAVRKARHLGSKLLSSASDEAQ